jgi:maltose O-acetyltransferase
VSGPSEKQKMLSGAPYRASDPELVAGQARAWALLREFNAADSAELRQALLSRIFGALGRGAQVKPLFACDYGYNIRAGANLFVNYNCVFLDCAPITIGDDVKIGPAVQIYTAQHPLDPAERRTGLEMAAPVTIGNNVWIGGGAILCPGVRIGDDAVVGAGSVVTRDVPNSAVAAGNPCRVIRQPVRPA